MTPDAVRAYSVLDFITEHPDLHDQSMFLRVAGRWPNPTAVRMIECGTTACFAGWTVLLAGDTVVWGDVDWVVDINGDGIHMDMANRAAVLLGLSYEDAWALFFASPDLLAVTNRVAALFGPRPVAAQ